MNTFVIGDLSEGIYWNSGVMYSILSNSEEIKLHTTGISSLIGVFIGLYGKNFFGRLIEFIDEKLEDISGIFKNSVYLNKYKQVLTLVKLGTPLYFHYKSELKKKLENSFGKIKVKDMPSWISFEAFDIQEKRPYFFEEDDLISDMLISNLSIPFYFPFFEYKEKKLVPSSYFFLTPYYIPQNSVIISFESMRIYNNIKNGMDIFLKIVWVRTLEIFKNRVKGHYILSPNKITFETTSATAAFNAGKDLGEKFLKSFDVKGRNDV